VSCCYWTICGHAQLRQHSIGQSHSIQYRKIQCFFVLFDYIRNSHLNFVDVRMTMLDEMEREGIWSWPNRDTISSLCLQGLQKTR